MKKNLIYLVILAGLAYALYHFMSSKDGSSITNKALTDFAIADTASIGLMVIDDGRNVVEVRRGEAGFWTLNDSLIAMPHHVLLLLKTFKNVGIQNPVSKSQKQTVMKIIMGDTRKVEVFDLDGEWIKTWYVGRSTQTEQGTYALLETPEEGMSDEPYVIEYRGFRGYLTTRFHASVNDWRWTGLFNYPELDFQKVTVETPKNPKEGFSIEVLDKDLGELKFTDHQGMERQASKQLMAQYLGDFKKINVEHFNLELTESQQDSIRNAQPDFRISVTDRMGKDKSADLYYRLTPVGLANRMGDLAPEIDPERMIVVFDGEIAYGQRLTFDLIMHAASEFFQE